MPVLVIGATSQIGHFMLPRLVAAGQEVLALSRQAQARRQVAGVRWLQGQLPDAVPGLPPLDAVVSFGPLDGLGQWLSGLQAAPAPRVVATSSMSLASKRDSQVPAERELLARLANGEAGIAAQCQRLGMSWTLLRPSLIYGAGLDQSLTPIARRAARTRLFPLPAGRGLRQPVHADDIAQAVMACLQSDVAVGRTLCMGGGERLPAAEMFARVRDSLPFATVPVHLGRPLMRLVAALLPATRGPVSRLDADLVVDNSEFTEALGITPRPFRVDASMWGLGGEG
ncbi:NAD-dependent epimerase/dehydratase [Pseudoxanthomonas suwonensis 11-1]|uniref:NAD-dependent epimerase/dehydratase n=1 Tax=Pseudoxanthomonas suwonensis (strain 11-1) TaxID=743721 RepID=E6WQE7_PSEUU|nr:NAD-dependent epimerase/dehydratase family protein [Pseudoxanthomonas suwonensis]ADV26396.1 NAD-dependent epimerase/dehydratase [Pseudoxanthomonas suwonensis 11-1]